MRTDEAILDEIIKDGATDVNEWPELLKRLLLRLDHIAHNSFPPTPAAAPTPAAPEHTPLTSSSPPTHSPSSSPMPPPPAPTSTPAFPTFPLPVATSALLTSLKTTLTTQFPTAPPYTLQRLAELLRNPTTHYTTLPKYLNALARVLSVTSPTTAFPLPPGVVDVPNGAFTLGSDESLGGALLSPIPWLTPTMLTEDENGAVVVSQGELLRHEQELRIVPSAAQEEGVVAAVPPPLGPEDVGPQPVGTVWPEVPATEEEAMSPMVVVEEVGQGGDTTMGEEGNGGKVAEGGGEVGQEEGVQGKEDVDMDSKEDKEDKAKELEDKMQLDAASDGKAEAEAAKEKERAEAEKEG